MPTSQPAPSRERAPLRLRLATGPEARQLDGSWWPHSRDLEVELADLVDRFPAERGRVVRALVSPPDWDDHPRRIPVARGYLKVGSFPRDDTHVVDLSLADRTVARLLVVPPDTSEEVAEGAMSASARPGNTTTGTAVLSNAQSPHDQWNEHGESWWEPHPVAPSFRTTE